MKISKILIAGLMIAAIGSQARAEENLKVVRDARINVVKNTFNNCVLTRWTAQSNECGGEAPKVAKPMYQPQERPIFDLGSKESRTIYFDFDKFNIKSSEVGKLDSLADALKSEEKLTGVHIVGYADRMGDAEYNQQLSKKRAEEVEAHLREQGYLGSTAADTRWLGATRPTTKCDDKLSRKEKIACLQNDRRVEVELEYK